MITIIITLIMLTRYVLRGLTSILEDSIYMRGLTSILEGASILEDFLRVYSEDSIYIMRNLLSWLRLGWLKIPYITLN